MEKIALLTERLKELSYLKSTLALLQWDQEVNMPAKGAARRGETMAYLAGLLHDKFLAINSDSCLTDLKHELEAGTLSDTDAAIVREVWREYERETKLPTDFVQELTKHESESTHVWAEARKNNDFARFLPSLERMIALKQREASLVGYTGSPYDALLDTFEPGARTTDVATIFRDLKDFLVPFLAQLQKNKPAIDPNTLNGTFGLAKQQKLNHELARVLGFDFDAGRIDTSTHPFATGITPDDVRITSRYSTTNLFYSVLATLHEVGHALYEQGIESENFGTPLGESISLAIHESQSRMWENMVGRSKPFWQFFYPKLQKTFPKPFATVVFDTFYATLNHVAPSLIRTEADEVTYNLHIIMRFELEKELIEGRLNAKDLPHAWHKKIKEYLGITVPNDSQGVLQDIHWASGLFGYFPTYALGNLYAAQFFATAEQAMPKLEQDMATGNVQPLREWLREHIHLHGKAHTASSLVLTVTGKPLSAQYFKTYIQNKYNDLYSL